MSDAVSHTRLKITAAASDETNLQVRSSVSHTTRVMSSSELVTNALKVGNNNNLHHQSPSSSFLIKVKEDLIKQEDRISPDSSSSAFHCCHCSAAFATEPALGEHLLEAHRVFSPPTRCPVCQKHVRDLPQHVAIEHGAASLAAAALGSQKGLDIMVTSSSLNDPPPPLDLVKYPGLAPPSPSSSSSPSHSPVASTATAASASAAGAPNGHHLLLRTTAEMLRAAAAANGIARHPRPAADSSSLPMNLSVRGQSQPQTSTSSPSIAAYSPGNAVSKLLGGHDTNGNSGVKNTGAAAYNPGTAVAKLLGGYEANGGKGSAAAAVVAAAAAQLAVTSDGDSTTSETDSIRSRKRRKQTHVPEANKDERYWARRLKNNEAAKRSRDMRIKREKVVFEENQRLEKENADLRTDIDRLATDNKELHLKLDIIMDENTRLKSVLLTYQSREEASRRLSSSDHNEGGPASSTSGAQNLSNHLRRPGMEEKMKPFPFPD